VLGREYGKPVLFFSRGTYNVTEYGLAFHDEARAPYLSGLRNAASAIGKLMPYETRRVAALRPRETAASDEERTACWRTRLGGQRGQLADDEALELLAGWGIPVAPWRLVAGPEEAVQAAEALGWPVALKLSRPGLTHKTEVGGVRLNLTSPAELSRAAAELLAVEGAGEAARLLVQRMAAPGVELLVSCVRDPQFGPMLYLGLGGILVEVLGDVQIRPAPIDALDAREMLDRLRGRSLLRGVRGSPPSDESAAVAMLVALSNLGLALGDLLETIEINPLVLGPRGEGGLAVDALVVAGPLR
jgi:acyl-CoA synthetase (NDP forming)